MLKPCFAGLFHLRYCRFGILIDKVIANIAALALPFAGALTGVLDGVPEHRDMSFSDDEKDRNDRLTPCCSRSLSKMLVLDLSARQVHDYSTTRHVLDQPLRRQDRAFALRQQIGPCTGRHGRL